MPEGGSALAVPSTARDSAELEQTLHAIARLPADQRTAFLLVEHTQPLAQICYGDVAECPCADE